MVGGSLIVALHDGWADAAVAPHQDEGPVVGAVNAWHRVAETGDVSRRTALEILAATPDDKGLLVFGKMLVSSREGVR